MSTSSEAYLPSAKTARATKAKKTMTIGSVMEALNGEFADLTVSKIRFLETEGLITPSRTASGYRRFTEADVERLRYILRIQRDQYLPLKVIRQQLDAMDEGTVAVLSTTGVEPMVAVDSFRASAPESLTDAEVAARAKCDVAFVSSLVNAGLVVPDDCGQFSGDDVRIVQVAVALQEFGFDERHLRQLRNTAHRQADIVTNAARVASLGHKDNAKAYAEEISIQMLAMFVSLHAGLMKNAVRRTMSDQ